LEYKQTKNQIENLKATYSLLQKEIALMEPLVKKGVASKLDLLKMRREASESLSKIKGA
jgi:adhesin transport system membrane fusion protein